MPGQEPPIAVRAIKCMDQRVAVPIARIGGWQRQHGADRLLVAFDHAWRAIWIGYTPTSVFRRPRRDAEPWNSGRGRTSENLTTRNRYVLEHISLRISGQQGARYGPAATYNYRTYGLPGQGDSRSQNLVVRLNIEFGHRGRWPSTPRWAAIGARSGSRIPARPRITTAEIALETFQ